MVLIQAHTHGEREIRADAHEHGPELSIVQIEAILHHPPQLPFQMTPTAFPTADADENARRLPGLNNANDLVWSSPLEIGQHQILSSALGVRQNGDIPAPGLVLHPAVVLLRSLASERASMMASRSVE